MQYAEAKRLLIAEGTSADGIPVCVRGNRDPGRDRMLRIINAIETLMKTEDLSGPIERRVAYALHVIALETNVQSHAWQLTQAWRDGGFHEDLIAVQDKIYQYLQGSLDFD